MEKAQEKEQKKEASTYIPEPEKLRLWVRAGGRCEICNKYLLEDELTVRPINLGEMAHNVGRKDSKRSPRGDSPLPVEKRNTADNLLLLCQDHHTVIDSRRHAPDFSVDELSVIKARHEDRIRHLTGMGEDQETVVLRVVGDIRGASAELSQEHVREVVLEDANRYPRFALAYGGFDLEIDLRGLPREGTPLYWEAGMARIQEILDSRLKQGAATGKVRHLSVFALTRIPLLVYLGYMIDDKVPVDLYQKHRDPNESWKWASDAPVESFKTEVVRAGNDPAKVALLISLSGTPALDDLPSSIDDDYTVFNISPVGTTPHRDILRSRQSLENFTSCYHMFLSSLEVSHKAADKIHLFGAMPVTAAVMCGRGLMRDAHPTLLVYDRSGEGYTYALEVNA